MDDPESSIAESIDANWDKETGPGDLVALAAHPLTPPSPEDASKPAPAADPAPAPVAAAPAVAPATVEPTASAAPPAGPTTAPVAPAQPDLIARLAALENEVTTLRAAPAPASAAPPAAPGPEPEPLPDLSGSVQQLDGTMRRVSDAYFNAEKALETKVTERQTQIDKLNEIREELRDPFEDTDSIALEAQAKRLQRQIGKLDQECRELDGRAANLHAEYHGRLKPEMDRLRVMERLHNDLQTRQSAEVESARSARVSGHLNDFVTAASAAAADRTVVPEELAESFLGTPGQNYEDGWLKPYCRSYLRPLPDGSGRYTVISDWPKFTKEAAVTFMERSRKIHSGFGAHFAKTKGSSVPPAGPGPVTAPAPAGAPALTHDSLEDTVDGAWEKEPAYAAR